MQITNIAMICISSFALYNISRMKPHVVKPSVEVLNQMEPVDVHLEVNTNPPGLLPATPEIGGFDFDIPKIDIDPVKTKADVVWNETDFYRLSDVALDMKDPSVLNIELHLNAGAKGKAAYSLSITTTRALEAAKRITSEFAHWRDVEPHIWPPDNYQLTRIAELNGAAAMIWEPVFVDGSIKRAPQFVIDNWPDFLDLVSTVAFEEGFHTVKFYIGHHNRGGGARWEGMSEEEFYTLLKDGYTGNPYLNRDLESEVKKYDWIDQPK